MKETPTLLPIIHTADNRMTFAELAPFKDAPFFIPMLFRLFRAGWKPQGDALVHE